MSGNGKPGEGSPRDYAIGPLAAGDLEAVIAIDRRLSGTVRRGFFERRLAAALREPDRFVYVGARSAGVLAGFALARLTEGEFGRQARLAALDAFGVEAAHQHHGVGHMLLDEIDAILAHKGIEQLTTQIDWADQDLVRFLAMCGFAVSPRLVLARDTHTPDRL
jgi:GNAT superfamily N-acetyltransferase